MQQDFAPTFLAEAVAWPPIMALVFSRVPVSHQLLVVNLITIADVAFLAAVRSGLLPWCQAESAPATAEAVAAPAVAAAAAAVAVAAKKEAQDAKRRLKSSQLAQHSKHQQKHQQGGVVELRQKHQQAHKQKHQQFVTHLSQAVAYDSTTDVSEEEVADGSSGLRRSGSSQILSLLNLVRV